jgi:hypothetical protein
LFPHIHGPWSHLALTTHERQRKTSAFALYIVSLNSNEPLLATVTLFWQF